MKARLSNKNEKTAPVKGSRARRRWSTAVAARTLVAALGPACAAGGHDPFKLIRVESGSESRPACRAVSPGHARSVRARLEARLGEEGKVSRVAAACPDRISSAWLARRKVRGAVQIPEVAGGVCSLRPSDGRPRVHGC